MPACNIVTTTRSFQPTRRESTHVAMAMTRAAMSRAHQCRSASARTKSAIRVGRLAFLTGYDEAVARQGVWQNTLKEIFKQVDFIALPTVQTPPQPMPSFRFGLMEARMLQLQNTVPVNFAGNPALALPIPLHEDSVALTSLQLIGPPLSEAQLLNAGRLVEASA